MKLIYILRAQCDTCSLDKMIVFYRVPNATPSAMYKGHEKQFRREIFPEKYNCTHKIRFTREIAKDYKWDEQKQVAVRR